MVRPDETRKAERACVNIQDRDVPHTCFTESFEDRIVEGLHVNSRFVSVSVV